MLSILRDVRPATVLFFALAIFAWLVGLQLSFWDQDEAAYAGFASEMIAQQDWLVPQFHWSDMHRKPPLHFWLIALSFKLFGTAEWVVRLPALLALLGTVLLVRFQTVAIFGEAVAKRAAWIMAANILLVSLVKISVTDSVLLFFETMAALALFNFMQQDSRQSKGFTSQTATYGYFVLGVAAALLVKGPPVLILVLGMMGGILLFHPNRWKLLRFHPWLLLPLAALPLVVWGYLAWQRDGGVFIQWMLDWYTFGRVSKAVLGQTGPPGYYLLVILLAFLPFLVFFPAAIRSLWRSNDSSESSSGKQLVLFFWLAAGWFFYEMMQSKLPAYAIGAFPALALLLSQAWEEARKRIFLQQPIYRWGLGLYVFVLIALAVALVVLPQLEPGLQRLLADQSLGRLYLLVALILLLGGAGIYALCKNRFSRAWHLFLLQAFSLLIGVWWGLLPLVEAERSATRQIAHWLGQQTEIEGIVAASNYRLPSLPFYVQQQGKTFRTATEISDWLRALQDPSTLIVLNSQDWEALVIAAQSEGISLSPRATWSGFISDKGKMVIWYVL